MVSVVITFLLGFAVYMSSDSEKLSDFNLPVIKGMAALDYRVIRQSANTQRPEMHFGLAALKVESGGWYGVAVVGNPANTKILQIIYASSKHC
jgi:hypothetical protein